MSGITSLLAAELSAAAFTPLASYSNGENANYTDSQGNVIFLSDWVIDTSPGFSASVGQNQVLVFVNSTTHQVVITFKGASPSQVLPDAFDTGFSDWEQIRKAAATALNNIKNTYSGYEILTDGDSLGGGLSQTFALENNLNGYAQNSIPIAEQSLLTDFNGNLSAITAQKDNYEANNTFTEINTVGDPATLYFTNVKTSGTFLATNITTLADPYSDAEDLGLSLLKFGSITLSPATIFIGSGLAVWGADEAHSIRNLIQLLSSGTPSGTQTSSLTPSQITTMVGDFDGSTITQNSNGTVSVSPPEEPQVNVTFNTNAAPPTSLTTPLAGNEAYVFDPTTNYAYVLTGTGTSVGTAIAYDAASDGFLTFDQGTTGAGDLTLPDGTAISVPGGGDMNLVSIASTTASSPLEILLDYLSEIGDPLTQPQLSTLDFDFQNPTGTAYTVTGEAPVANNNSTAAAVTYDLGSDPTPGAVVAGQSTATIVVNGKSVSVPAINIISAVSADLSQDAISGIQVLQSTGNIELTQTEFAGLSEIDGGGLFTLTVTGTTGGTYNLGALTLNGISGGGTIQLAANSLDPITLIGSSQNHEMLTASDLGNDTLEAGSGTDDTLIAGGGIDTLIGGSGGDTFLVNNGLADRSVVTGAGSGNLLQATGDISSATISGVQTLQVEGTVMLTASQLAGFNAIQGVGTIDTTTGGTFDLLSSSTSAIGMAALSSEGTTLIGDNASDALTASISGNDTLTAGNGNLDALEAANTSGNNVLTTGTGSNDALDVVNSSGDNTLTANGASAILIALGSSGNNVLTSDGASASVDLDAENSSGNNTLTAGDGAGDILNASGSSGNNFLRAGNGNNDAFVAGSGVTTMISGTGNDTFEAIGGLAAGSFVQGGGGNDALTTGGDLSAVTVSGVQTLDTTIVTLTNAEFNGFSTIADTAGLGIIETATGGIYDLVGRTADVFDMEALSNSGTTLIGNNASNEQFFASASGNDTLISGSGSGDALFGGGNGGAGGNDVLIANGNNALVEAGIDNDTLTANGNNDQLFASIGNDTLTATGANDILTGGFSNTTLSATGASDTLIGEAGANLFLARGNNIIDGGGSDNTVSYAVATMPVVVTLDSTGGVIDPFGDTLSDIQNIIGGQGNDTLTVAVLIRKSQTSHSRLAPPSRFKSASAGLP